MITSQSIEPKMDFDKNVLSQLNKILLHPLFLNSDILSGFLHFIVHETLAGRENQIKEYTIALNVLKKPVSFEPSNNAIVRIHAKRLRNALLTYYEQKGFNDDCIITIPKGRYIPMFEMSDNSQLSKKTGAASLYKLVESKKNRIACLPFKTYDRIISRTSFVDSLGEELTRQFSYYSDLSVLSYHSTRMLSRDKNDIKYLVSSYQVQFLITGSCRFEQSKIRIFVELIDAESESQVWSGIYSQTSDTENYFRIVDNITTAVIRDLGKIKVLALDSRDPFIKRNEELKDKPGILYLDSYVKTPKPTRRIAGS
jgi:TolB-like protein